MVDKSHVKARNTAPDLPTSNSIIATWPRGVGPNISRNAPLTDRLGDKMRQDIVGAARCVWRLRIVGRLRLVTITRNWTPDGLLPFGTCRKGNFIGHNGRWRPQLSWSAIERLRAGRQAIPPRGGYPIFATSELAPKRKSSTRYSAATVASLPSFRLVLSIGYPRNSIDAIEASPRISSSYDLQMPIVSLRYREGLVVDILYMMHPRCAQKVRTPMN